MPLHARPYLRIVPGQERVLFSVRLEGAHVVLGCRPTHFLEGLDAACALLRLGPVLSEEAQPEEFLPWAGDV